MQWRNWKKGVKTLDEIQVEYGNRCETDREPWVAELHKAEAALDALLDRAGIRDTFHGERDTKSSIYEELFSRRSSERAYYRRRMREAIFAVSDIELRKEIMLAVNHVRAARWRHAWGMSRLGETFADQLRRERCQVPQTDLDKTLVSVVVVSFLLAAALGWVPFFNSGVLLFLAFLSAYLFEILHHIGVLQQHDVTMQEGIAFVERNTAPWTRDEKRLLHRPDIWSSREKSTGEPDA